jgi:hypothetical protein
MKSSTSFLYLTLKKLALLLPTKKGANPKAPFFDEM